MKTIAYLRVSTLKQDADNQRLAILDFAQKEQIKVDRFIESIASSRSDLKRRLIDELLEALADGDRLIVSELSRLGRSVGQIITICDDLAKRKIKLIAIKENIRLEGARNIGEKMMLTMFSLLAEIERDLISERTKEGLAGARARGKLLGRPKGSLGKSMLDGREDEIQLFLGKRVSKASLSRILGCSENTLKHFLASRGLGAKEVPKRPL